MADIDVVPKRRTNVWLWVIVALVVALILFAVMGTFSGEPTQVGELMGASPFGTSVGVLMAT